MHFTIKDIENLSGIKAHTIRIWEQRYSLLKPDRTGKNIRLYDDQQLKTILNIALLNKFGYKISHINNMSEDVISDKIISLTSSEAKNEITINDLIDKMVKVEMEVFEELIDNFIKKNGIEKTLLQIIFPFLERIGVLWLTNHINPAQEHLVTNIIRQKIIVGIEGVSNLNPKNKSVCMFLPEGEYHELSFLFINYLLKKEGVKTIYLGASIPLDDMDLIVKLKKPDFIYTHLTSVTGKFNFESFLKSVYSHFPDVPKVISGRYTLTYQKKTPANVYLKKSMSEVMEFIYSF